MSADGGTGPLAFQPRRVPPFRSGLAPWRLARVEAVVADNLGRPLRLADLARAAGLSRMHFAAQFRATTGLPPHAYLVSCRVERAKALLSDTPLPLADIARAVGVRSHSHFSTVFRRRSGVAPMQWRRRHAARDLHEAAPAETTGAVDR
jgi:transcriptional regulator GlxA family with amidase domain